MKEINFSKLTLDLKKQFIYFLAKNDIDFHKLKNTKFLTTKIKIKGMNNRPTRITIRPGDLNHLTRKNNKISRYHIDCVKDSLKYRSPSPAKKHRFAKTEKTKKSKKNKNWEKSVKKSSDILGKDLLKNLGEFAELKDELRSEPREKVDRKKHHDWVRNRYEFAPNKDKKFGKGDDDIVYNNDVMDNKWYYQKLGDRLGMRKRNRGNFLDKNFKRNKIFFIFFTLFYFSFFFIFLKNF